MDRHQKLQEIGKTYAATMFQEFSDNPGYRGPNFTWDEFPDLVTRMATSSTFLYFPNTETITQEDEDVVAEAARTTAIELVGQHYQDEA